MHAESLCTIGAEAISVICPFSLFLFLQIFRDIQLIHNNLFVR